MKKVLFILGPTAVGKTYFSVKLAQKFNGEIISSDSVQIYRGLDIGSAKVTKEEMQGVPHHAIDILEPEEEFSVYEFVEYTRKKIDEIISRNKLPIVVGGTGLYVKALLGGYNFGGAEKDENLRKKLENLSNEQLFEMLSRKDEKLAQKTDKNNKVRLIRAIEIASSNGEKTQNKVDIDALVVALNRERSLLYSDINKRVDIMLQNGLLEEVEGLKRRGLTAQNQSMRAIDYKEVLAYLDGQYSYEKMVEILKQHSRNYAKRQLTFLRGMENVHFIDTEDREKAFKDLSNMIEKWK